MMMKPKFIAYYLPQYHEIPENNQWWGKGFTEWERLKKAKPLFCGHNQPRIPKDFYDIADVNIMVKQVELAKKYGLYGFCYYHYWFNGKKLLEKPLDQMLKEPKVDIPFCLSWANEPWTRAWSGNNKEILMPQEYGGENEWEEHLNYLIPFFLDGRYIKKEGRPVFLIYRTESFDRFDEMIKFWNNTLVERGFEKMYIIEMLTSFQKKPFCINSQAVVEFEPMLTVKGYKSSLATFKSIIKKIFNKYYANKHTSFDYERVCSKIIKRNKTFKTKELFLGAFPDWDNTPRFGERGAVFNNVSTEIFGELLLKQSQKSTSDFIFINAWNEWTEGAYLEPDQYRGTELLKEIAKVNGK